MTETPERHPKRCCVFCGATPDESELMRSANGNPLCVDAGACIQRFEDKRRERASRGPTVLYFDRNGQYVETR